MSTFLSIALGAQISSAQLLDAIGHVESGMNHAAVGDHGHSRGAWQMGKYAWRKLSPQNWKTYAHIPSYARTIAGRHMEFISGEFQFYAKRRPTCEDMLCMWQLGFSGYKRVGFDQKKAPSTTQSALKRLTAHLQAGSVPAPATTHPPGVASRRASISDPTVRWPIRAEDRPVTPNPAPRRGNALRSRG